jgi:Fe-S cluster biogenesis protein NfuA
VTDPAAHVGWGTEAPVRLDDRAVHRRIAVLDEQLARLEATPGPIGELALVAVSGLAEIYGQALARALDLADPATVERMVRDGLIGHLLTLHGIHPDPVPARVARVIEELRAALSTRGAEIELVGIDGAATVRVSVRGCGSNPAAVEQVIRDAVLAAAPELTGVVIVMAGQQTFVPVDSLMRPPTGAAGPP